MVIPLGRLVQLVNYRMTRRSFNDVNDMFDELNRLFDQMSANFRDGEFGLGFNGVSLDLQTQEDGYVLVGDLPGFDAEEIDVVYMDGTVRIDATHDLDDEDHAGRRSVHEEISVPTDIIVDDATATYRNGVLEVVLPATDPDTVTGHRIDVVDA